MNANPHPSARQRNSLPRTSRLLGPLAVLMIVAASCVILLAAVPEGWIIAGSQPSKYEAGVDTTLLYLGHRSAYLKAKEATGGFGTLMQSFDAKNYLGKRVRFSATVKTDDVVLDVPQDATGIFFGILLDAAGEVWLSDVKFEVVGTEVPTTGIRPKPQRSSPVNLDFQQP